MDITPVRIGDRLIAPGQPAYIIAEIGSNFDGSLERAKHLAKMSKEAGADAYKIQNFIAEKIVSAEGFRGLQVAHQSKWDRPVVEVYKSAEFPREWVKELADYCREIGIDFFSSPYDTDAVDLLESIDVPAHKIGSGEIDNLEFLTYVAKTGKPVIIATGSATLEEIETAVSTVRAAGNEQIVLLQCVTNYPSPVKDANLRAMVALGERFDVPYGYSDHTTGIDQGGDDPLHGMTVPLGSVALGGAMIEKHVTDDPSRSGPDHPFAMQIDGSFKDMIAGVRALESAFGDGQKRLMESEKETVVVQRRGVCTTRDIEEGEVIAREDLEFLRPALGLKPPHVGKAVGKKAARRLVCGSPVREDDLV